MSSAFFGTKAWRASSTQRLGRLLAAALRLPPFRLPARVFSTTTMNNIDDEDLQKRIDKALKVAVLYAHCAGDHHRLWVIDQMVRALTGRQYKKWLATVTKDENGTPHVDLWDKGDAP